MATGEEQVRALREALKVSPNNLPLRTLLAQTLAGFGRWEDAATEYRAAIGLSPKDASLKLRLAEAFAAAGKSSQAIVVVEDLLANPDADPAAAPKAHLLYARLLHAAGDDRAAAHQYRKAIDADESLADETLAESLGVEPDFADEDDPCAEVDSQGRVRQYRDGASPDASAHAEIEKPRIAFSDVGGMESVKDEIRMKIIHPLTHPEIYKAYGKTIGGGILMYGPPGCGKTHLARATAGEVKAGFICIGIHDVLDMWIGNSEKQLHGLFDAARRNTPCVLFFDEVDALGASRSDMRQSAGRNLINQFLSELDGVTDSNEGLLILAATNAPWHLDPAFRRPGRFDRVLFVPPPDAEARADILRILLQGKPAERIDYEHVAKKTPEFSGADMKAVVDIAVERKLREAMSRGVPTPLATRDLVEAAKQHRPTTAEWFATARNYALYANQGGIYDDILHYMKLR